MSDTTERVRITRAEAHAKLDGIFDELERMAAGNGGTYDLERIMLQVQSDSSLTGCVLVRRSHAVMGRNLITWGIMPYENALHSGHYDLTEEAGLNDWLYRVDRGW